MRVRVLRSVALVLAITFATPALAASGPALQIGDGRVTTDSPKAGWIYACRIMTGGGGASGPTPWIDGNLWYPNLKPSVQGAVQWKQAKVTFSSTSTHRMVTTMGVPTNATTGTFPIATSDPVYQFDRNPNAISPKSVTVSITKNPKVAAKPGCLSLGPIGYSLNGVAIFNGLDGESRDAVAHEMQDVCGGHPERTGQYHYHLGSTCIAKQSKTKATLIGYALDGFGIYFENDSKGKPLTNAALDACHGRVSEVVFDGKLQKMYHYVATAEYPYTLGCYKGTPATVSSSVNQPAGDPPPGPGMNTDPRAAQVAASVIGLAEAEALVRIVDAGLPVRIISRDGVSYPVTKDLRPNRINLTIVTGKVTQATLG